MFSVLNLDYAYVTGIGRLIGVVSLKEVRVQQTHINEKKTLHIIYNEEVLHWFTLGTF